MGNHCIDCKFCGQDRRIVGNRCCPEYIAQEEKEQAARDAKWEAERAYLSRYGLVLSADGRLYGDAVIAMLKKREGKVLKPGRAKPKPVYEFDEGF